MSYPILYAHDETNFSRNGLGILSSCVSCVVTEETSGAFELLLQYPIDGIHFSKITNRAIIKAKPNQSAEPQLFRVYSIKKAMPGKVTVAAQHISYDLSGIPVSTFSAENVNDALSGLKENAVVGCPFEFWTDKSTEAKFTVSKPGSLRSMLGGSAGSILDVYMGEYEWDNYTVKLHAHRGSNRGVSIRYGKNLINLKQEENAYNIATGVYPFWYGLVEETETLVELPEKIINAAGTYNFEKIKMLDLTADFPEKPTEEALRSRAEKYIADNDIGIPKVSMTISFAQLEQSDEYKHLNLLELVNLFDIVQVEFPGFNVSATAKAVKIVYDVIADRVDSVTLGSAKSNVATTISNQENAINSIERSLDAKPNKNDLVSATQSATDWLTSGKGYKVERKDEYGRSLDTLYLDEPNIETATKVLKIGQNGIEYSNTGISGPWFSIVNMNGVIKSTKDDSVLIMENAELKMKHEDKTTGIVKNEIVYNIDSGNQEVNSCVDLSMFSGSDKVAGAYFGPNIIKFDDGGLVPSLKVVVKNGETWLYINQDIQGKKISWKQNQLDGTYTLIGEVQ